MAARCLSTLAQVNTSQVMVVVIHEVVPLLSVIENLIKRQGAAETIFTIINKLQLDIVPYVVLLVVPLLGKFKVYYQLVFALFYCLKSNTYILT